MTVPLPCEAEAEAVRDADPTIEPLPGVAIAVALSAKTCGLYEYFSGLGTCAFMGTGARVVCMAV